MKIRTGFVSNSSSSSFIVKKSIIDEIKTKIDADKFYSRFDDSFLSKDEVIKIIKSDIEEFDKETSEDKEKEYEYIASIIASSLIINKTKIDDYLKFNLTNEMIKEIENFKKAEPRFGNNYFSDIRKISEKIIDKIIETLQNEECYILEYEDCTDNGFLMECSVMPEIAENTNSVFYSINNH